MRDDGKFDRTVPTWAEIGRELGITGGGAWMLYKSAMIKLRRRCSQKQLEELRGLIRQRAEIRRRSYRTIGNE